MRVLITGNQGYVGPVLQRVLKERDPTIQLHGLDAAWFAHNLSVADRSPDRLVDIQYCADVRQPPAAAFEGVDAVVQLAAISNDPMGNAWESLTDEVNHQASLEVARQAKRAGVRSFVFASSCSMYGAADGVARSEDDALNPLTAYARSKVATENGLQQLASDDFHVTCLRFATACGMSDRLRLDLVLNDFVAGAVTSGRIEVLSDGTPWRPLIAVEDMSSAIDWAIRRPVAAGGTFLAVNTGSSDWNFQVRDLAAVVADAVPGTDVSINENAAPDKRSYRVDFSRFARLAPGWAPRRQLREVVDGLAAGLRAIDFSDSRFREGPYIRLHTLTAHRQQGRLDASLRWIADADESIK